MKRLLTMDILELPKGTLSVDLDGQILCYLPDGSREIHNRLPQGPWMQIDHSLYMMLTNHYQTNHK